MCIFETGSCSVALSNLALLLKYKLQTCHSLSFFFFLCVSVSGVSPFMPSTPCWALDPGPQAVREAPVVELHHQPLLFCFVKLKLHP